MKLVKKLSVVLSGLTLCGLALTGCNTNNLPLDSNQAETSGQNTGKNITIGYFNWDEDVATTYLWKHLLEDKGYHVTLQTLALGPMFVGLSEGGVDVFFDSWLPEQNPYINKYQDNVTSLGKWYTGTTREGFVVPTYMKNVHSVADLNKVSSELQGQIVGIDPGSVEMNLAQSAIQQYGLKLSLTPSSGPAMLSVLEKAYAAKQDVAVVLWSPHWAFAKYQLKYLSDPKGVFGKAGWIQTEANKEWINSHAEAAGWLKNFKLTPYQLGTLEEDINHAKSPDAGVTKWIQNNQGVVNSWFQ